MRATIELLGQEIRGENKKAKAWWTMKEAKVITI